MRKYQKMSKSKSVSNKPIWEHAPDWAKYLAMDRDGEWLWHEKEPVALYCGSWDSEAEQTHAKQGSLVDILVDWTTTKEERP